MAAKITGGAPREEKRRPGPRKGTIQYRTTEGDWHKPFVVCAFIVYLAAWVILITGIGYGVILGLAHMAAESRDMQVAAAISVTSGVFIFGLALAARGDR